MHFKSEKSTNIIVFQCPNLSLFSVIRKATFCAKFAATKPAESIMEFRLAMGAEDSSNGASGDWQQGQSDGI